MQYVGDRQFVNSGPHKFVQLLAIRQYFLSK